jgi:adenine-specific DNA-methyltransferase
MIYLDPPYGIKFASNFQPEIGKRDVKDKETDLTREPEMVKAYRDTWTLGVHSYLSYLRDRLIVARELLADTGSIFVQIGDENIHRVRMILDDVFGPDCSVVTITVKKKGSQKSGMVDPVNDYLLWYTKTPRTESTSPPKFRKVFVGRELDSDTLSEFHFAELPDGRQYPITAVPSPAGDSLDYGIRPSQLFKDYPSAKLFRPWPITNGGERKNQSVPFLFQGREIDPPKGRCWSHTARSDHGTISGMGRVAAAERLLASGKALDYKRYYDDFSLKTLSNWWDGLGGASSPVYVVQTNPEIVQRCILMTTDPGDLVLDCTGGSGTTAYVAEQWGRRWITIDTSRVAIAIARQRLLTAKFDYFKLHDEAAGVSGGLAYRKTPRITSSTTARV